MKGFRDKLKQLQVCTAAERSQRIPLSDEELGLRDGAARFREVRTELADRLESMMNEFAGELESFSQYQEVGSPVDRSVNWTLRGGGQGVPSNVKSATGGGQ